MNNNIKEKIRLFIGKNTWETNENKEFGIRSLRMNDGPHGLRKISFPNSGRINTTCFPTAVNLASTFNPSLVKKVGMGIADECREAKVHILLGPGINLKRTPLGGRCFEYYSEDPYLTGMIAQGFIKGVQSRHVGTSLKHFICNEQEYYRLTSSSEVDDLAFYNLYLKAFKLALKAKPTTVMASYNKLNGTYTTENKFLLTDILREKLKYKGIVISDWGAVNKIDQAIISGTNIEMPYSGEYNYNVLLKSYQDKVLTDKVINERVKEIKSIQKRIFDEKIDYLADLEKNHKLAKRVSDESIVLLKNDGTLPLNKKTKTLFIGAFCEDLIIQATGSAKVAHPNKIEVLDYLKQSNYKFDYLKGYNIDDDYIEEELVEEVLTSAADYSQIVLFAGLYEGLEGEGYDRCSHSIPNNQLYLINKLIENNTKFSVVLLGGSSVALPFIDKISALIEAYLPGECGSESIIDILYGKVNPSGRLPETFAYNIEDIPSTKYSCGNNCVNYKESIYIGYRYFDKAQKETLFPFGYGLSYSKFSYSDFDITSLLSGKFKITNTSNISGKEVYQIYLRKPNTSGFAPVKELVQFGKVNIPKNGSVEVNYTIDEEELLTYVSEYNDYVALDGEYEVVIATNARDILYSKKFNLKTNYPVVESSVPECYVKVNNQEISDEDFAVILKRKVQKPQIKIRNYTINTSLYDFIGLESGEAICTREINWINSLFPKETLRKSNEVRAGLSSPIKCKAVFDPGVSWEDVYEIVQKANEEVKLKIRKGTLDDFSEVMNIYEDAVIKFEKELTFQWKKGYPNYNTYTNDINNHTVLLCLRGKEIVGVLTAILTGESDYDEIDGKWLNDKPYLTIHRVAVKNAYLGYGVATALFNYAKEFATSNNLYNIRIDTHELNKDMKKLLTRLGFIKCGIITLKEKNELRDAYHLEISNG